MLQPCLFVLDEEGGVFGWSFTDKRWERLN
jgi:hypothetical protein